MYAVTIELPVYADGSSYRTSLYREVPAEHLVVVLQQAAFTLGATRITVAEKSDPSRARVG